MEYIDRELERKFLEMDRFFKAVLVIGARQVGKSTMLKQLAKQQHRTIVTMDDDFLRELAQNDPRLFFQTYKPPILIDEIQKAPELLETIKILCDESDLRGQFWLTGSQRKKIMEKSQESLAGRLGILHLYGLSQREKAGVLDPAPLDFTMACLQSRKALLPDNDINAVFEHSWNRPITSPTSTTTWSPMPSMTRGSKTCRPSSASSAPALLWSGIWSIIERWARQQGSLKPRRKSGLPSCRTWTWCICWSHTPTTNCSVWSKHQNSISATPGCAPISPAG